MATTVITPDRDAVISEIHIAAPPERVFQAITDPKQVMAWWNSEDCQIENFSIETRPGGRWVYDTRQTAMNVNGVSKFHCEGEVLEYDPPRSLAYTWIANWHDDKSRRTVVRWELTPKSGGTQVKITHSGLVQEPAACKDYSNGWPGVAVQLRKYLER
ncbi:MAG TPA: SRPBCC domain-containing protein [Candidatus Sulfotelmatobacter sp.]|nr:SRPBCC domain-containing protein [Candidatus Sulfotelmatobacter sp.]